MESNQVSTSPNKKVKVSQNHQHLLFDVDAVDSNVISWPSSFTMGIEMAINILQSKTFKDAFLSLVDDCDTSMFDTKMSEQYHLKISTEKDVLTAYCSVRRVHFPNVIWFNPILIINMALKLNQMDSAAEHDVHLVIRTQALFLAMKIVHEMAHILHYCCSQKLRESATKMTPIKVIIDKIEEGERAVNYDDIGTLIEKIVFGGCIELKSSTTLFMDFDRIGIYDSVATLFGNYVDVEHTVITADEIRIIRGEKFRSKNAPNFARADIKGGAFSRSSVAADSDVVRDNVISGIYDLGDDDDDDDNDDAGSSFKMTYDLRV